MVLETRVHVQDVHSACGRTHFSSFSWHLFKNFAAIASKCTHFSEVVTLQPDNKKEFDLVTKDRTFRLRARSTNDRDGWVTNIMAKKNLMEENALFWEAEQGIQSSENDRATKQIELLLSFETLEGILACHDSTFCGILASFPSPFWGLRPIL